MEKMNDKIGRLLFQKEKELNLVVVGQEFDDRNNLHVLCNRRFDNSYIVWTAYNTDEEKNSFENFYNGKYDMTLEEGVQELERRRDRYRNEEKMTTLNVPKKKRNVSLNLER